jgi:hypothetical protein
MGYKKRTVRNTGDITDEIVENVPEVVPEAVVEIPEENHEEDAVMKRKLEIAEKRRASLALARSKIIPKSQLKKQADEVIKSKDEVIRSKQEETDAMRLKYERDRVKQLEDSLMALQKLIVEKPAPVVAPVTVEPVVETKPKYKRPSRAKSAVAERVVEDAERTERSYGRTETKQPQQIIPKKTVDPRITRPVPTETLIDKSYSEQLQERLRTQAINRIMSDTFGGF